VSVSASSEICCRNSSTEPFSFVASYSRATCTSSSRFSSRPCASIVRSASSASVYPVSLSVSWSTSPTGAPDPTRSFSRSMVDMKRLNAFWAAVPSPGTWSGASAASHTETPIVSAWESTRESDVCPSPRLGELAIRVNVCASWGLTRKVRYAIASLISARS
jgi:hypothetical protein